MASPMTGGLYSRFEPTGNAEVDALLMGAKWGPSSSTGTLQITYSFPTDDSYWSTYSQDNGGYDLPESGNEPWNDFIALTSYEQDVMRSVFEHISSVANISFVEVSESSSVVGDIRIAYSGDVGDEAAAHAYFPNGFQVSPTTHEGEAYAFAGDIWIKSDGYADFFPYQGNYDYLVFLHELGHALGLKHTFSQADSFPTINPALDSYAMSVMSYSAIPGDSGSTLAFFPTTLMSADIYALQYLYGANMNYHAGDDLYQYSESDQYFETIWDAGGNDSIVYTSETRGGEIDLRPGGWSALGQSQQYISTNGSITHVSYTVNIPNNVVIENAFGGNGSDFLIGNDAGNSLFGYSGNDTISGGIGSDSLNGGSGVDVMTGGAGDDVFVVDSTQDVIRELKDGGTDIIATSVTWTMGKNFEYMILLDGALNGNGSVLSNAIEGNSAANRLKGNFGDDHLSGQNGNDTLSGGAGNDTLIGGVGIDRFLFESSQVNALHLDHIVDFEKGIDRIQLDDLMFTGLTIGSLASSAFALGTRALELDDRIIYDKASGSLYYDADGSGSLAKAKFAILDNLSELSVTDIQVV